MANENKKRLSKSVLEMKFMTKSKEKAEKEQFQKEGEKYFGEQITTSMKKQTGQFIIEPSFFVCEQLIEGRVSFNGMNPEIEKIMEYEALEKFQSLKKEKEEEADVSDSEMADRFRKLKKIKTDTTPVKSTHKKWLKREDEPVEKKPKFLKPED